MITLLPWLLKRQVDSAKCKTVVTLHELAGPMAHSIPTPVRRAWLLPLLFASDAAIVTNERDLSLLRRVPGLKRRLNYIPFGSNIDANGLRGGDRQAIRRKLGIDEGETLVARFGFVHDLRANLFPELVLAIKRLSGKDYRVRLLLIGGGNQADRKEVTALAHSVGIEDLVLFTGFCSPDEVSGYLVSADIGIQLYPEGVCEKRTGLLAALAHGLPVVGLGKGHVASMFIDRENIALTPSSNPDDIAATVEGLIVDCDLRNTVSKNAILMAARFNWVSIGKAMNELYGKLSERLEGIHEDTYG
jgi:glycosyltransferase involved in cell wall biosynthesis